MRHIVAFVLGFALVAFGGRWDGPFVPISTTTASYAADAGAGITVTITQGHYYKVTCDKDFRAAVGTPPTSDGGFFCHDVASRCDLFRSTLGEKMYVQTSTETRIAIRAANATDVAVCSVFRN